MSRRTSAIGQFEVRRRKEYLAFLVVKFLKAYEAFRGIQEGFEDAARRNCLAECGLYKAVWDLVETLGFDMKEKAHYLFRTGNREAHGAEASTDKDTRHMIQRLTSSIETRSIDSYIATGYHLLLILGESLYQLERYTPEFHKEQSQIGAIERLAEEAGYTFSPEEAGEMEQLRGLSDISMKVSAETEELIFRFMVRCESLFKGTAEVIRRFIEGAGENEILIQNLLQNIDLLEKVYGEGSAEKIFWVLCRHKRVEGQTGLEKALNFARARCGNVTGLSDLATLQSAPAEVPSRERSS
jgi:hypothetical protein